jgi:hypothetical protein
VVLLAAEDGLADTIRPRLDAAGAAPTRVHHLDTVPTYDAEGHVVAWVPPSIPEDLTALEALIVQNGAVLVVIDVLMAYLTDRVDSHRDQDVRRALAQLADVAERTGACIVLLRHLRKSRGLAMYAGGGSVGIIGVARAGMVAAIDPYDEMAPGVFSPVPRATWRRRTRRSPTCSSPTRPTESPVSSGSVSVPTQATHCSALVLTGSTTTATMTPPPPWRRCSETGHCGSSRPSTG